MANQCAFPNCKITAPNGMYCPGHKRMMGEVSIKPPKPIPVRSDKQKEVIAELKKLYKVFLSKPGNDKCKLKMDGCTKKAETVHHVRGRIGNQVLVQKDWLPSCFHCNGEVERKHAEAEAKGLKKSKFQKS